MYVIFVSGFNFLVLLLEHATKPSEGLAGEYEKVLIAGWLNWFVRLFDC